MKLSNLHALLLIALLPACQTTSGAGSSQAHKTQLSGRYVSRVKGAPKTAAMALKGAEGCKGANDEASSGIICKYVGGFAKENGDVVGPTALPHPAGGANVICRFTWTCSAPQDLTKVTILPLNPDPKSGPVECSSVVGTGCDHTFDQDTTMTYVADLATLIEPGENAQTACAGVVPTPFDRSTACDNVDFEVEQGEDICCYEPKAGK